MRHLTTCFAFLAVAQVYGQQSILDMRENYNIGQTVTVTGVVTSDDNLGSVRYLQDATAGIALYPGQDWSAWEATPQIGDSLSVTGEISEYNGLLEVGPNLTNVTFLGQGTVPTTLEITPSQMGEDLEGQLVRINGVTFPLAGTFITGNNTYDFSAAGESGIIYIRTSNSLIGEELTGCEVDMLGIVSQFSFDGTGGYQLLPRGPVDLVSSSPLCFTSSVVQSDLAPTSFTLSWTTDVACDGTVEYGLTEDLGLMASAAMGDTTSHAVDLVGLEPGTIYYARAVSTLEDGSSAASTIRPYATVSESSGNIHVYFNGPVDHSVATDDLALSLGTNMNDTLAAWILSAQHTLDVAVYNLNDQTVEDAINAAAANGVQIRWIYEGQNANIGLSSLDGSVVTHPRTDGEGSGMHNKFIIGDADHVESAFVLTGSTNFTTGNFEGDLNNVIVLEDQSLARAYELEFEEMWGAEGMTPDAANAKFGADKSWNTPVDFIVGGSPVELYFSPTDGTNAAILEEIEATNADFEFALLTLTRDDLGDAIVELNQSFFVSPMGVIEQVNVTGSEFDNLISNGVQAYAHDVSGNCHHKYAIVDHSEVGSDPLVITGSHNWSYSAENVNDENTLIVHDARVANLYHQEFRGLTNVINGIEEEVVGCTDSNACNFSPSAITDDGSCTYSCGCTDPSACNYDVTAMVDDGSCCACVDAGPLPLLNQTWKFSSVAGAIAIGPNPGSTEWYASTADGLQDWQYDDRWQLYPDGTFVYDNNGSTLNPFDGYVETPMTVAPSTYTLELQAGPNGEDLFTVSGLTTEAAEICGWMGVWDSGPTYTITELTEERLVLSALQQGGDCINPVGSGYFTLIFESEGLTFSDGGSELGICLSGCTDPSACNHWELAEYEDGSCDYSCQGCTDPFALNFAEGATFDNGACLYASCADVGSSYWAEGFEAGLYTPPGDVLMHGVPFGSEWVVNLPSLITEPGSGQVFATEAWTDLSVVGLPPGVVLDIQDSASVAGSGQLCIAASGTPEMPGTYMAEVTGTLLVSLFGSFLEIGVYSTLTQIEVLPNPNPIPGCTYPDAANYVPYADQDNGSCVYEGCADPLALNHYPFIAIDDGSCVYGEIFDASCGADINQDGNVTSADLLALLSSFGQLCD